MAFCSGCGSKIPEGAAFCNNCGNKVSGGEVKIHTEEIRKAKLVLSTSKIAGFLKRVPCYIVFFDDELLLAHLGKERQKNEIMKFRDEQKEQGKGFLKTTLAMMGFWRDFGLRYYDMHRQLILEEEPDNQAISYSKITRLVFRAVTRSVAGVNDVSSSGTSQGKLQIKTDSGKIKFTHNYYDSNKKIKQILTALFGKALKYRGSFLTLNLKIGGGTSDGIS